MKASEPPGDSAAGLKKMISEKQAQFTGELERLYRDQAQRYLDDAFGRYLAFQEAESIDVSKHPPVTLEAFAVSAPLHLRCHKI